MTAEDQQRFQSGSNNLFNKLNLPKTAVQDHNKEETVQLPAALSVFAAITPVCPKLDTFVVDWSLKTKARFTSKTPFTFSSTLKVSPSVRYFL